MAAESQVGGVGQAKGCGPVKTLHDLVYPNFRPTSCQPERINDIDNLLYQG